MPLVSVIVPVYKVEKYIHRCVDSILRQTFSDFELILVDDGSPDNCGVICDEYAKKDNRVYVIHQKNGGLSAARNAGLDWIYVHSHSEWISFIDSDDWVHEKYLEILIDSIVKTDKLVSICKYKETKGELLPKVTKARIESVNCEKYYCDYNVNATVAWGKLYKKSCFEKIRFPLGRIHEDEFTTYKVLFEMDEVIVVFEELYAYFINPDGIMNSKWSMKRLDAISAREQQKDFFKMRNYTKAYKEICKKYCYTLASSVEEMIVNNIEKKKINKYRKKLKVALLKYRNIQELKFRKDNYWVYEKAYPSLMATFWKVLALKNKIME